MSVQPTKKASYSKSHNAKKLLLASMVAATAVGTGSAFGEIPIVDASAGQKSLVLSSNESTNQTQTQTFKIPGLTKLNNVVSNTGKVEIVGVDGENVTVKLTGGKISKQVYLYDREIQPKQTKNVNIRRDDSVYAIYKHGWTHACQCWNGDNSGNSPVYMGPAWPREISHREGDFTGSLTGEFQSYKTIEDIEYDSYGGPKIKTKTMYNVVNYSGTIVKPAVTEKVYENYYKYDLTFDYDTNVAPTTPTLTVPEMQFEHGDQHIIGFNSTDANGDPIIFTLEATYDEGKTWSQLYTGTNKTFTYTVPKDKTQVQFRVLASDGAANSAYTTSTNKSIQPVQYYWNKYGVTSNYKTTLEWDEANSFDNLMATQYWYSYYSGYSIDATGKYVGQGSMVPGEQMRTGNTYYYVSSYGTLEHKMRVIEHYGTNINGRITRGKETKVFSHYTKGALVQNNIKGGINAYQHGTVNPDGYWYERGQRVLSEDVTPPIIELSEQADYNVTSTVTVKTHDLGTVTSVKWAKGNQPVSYFTSNGTAVTGGEFTVSENGEYTVYAVDNKGNAAVEVINVTKINGKPVIASAATSTPYVVLDNTSEFQVHGNAHDPDGQDITVTVTHLNATGSASVIDGRYELTLSGSDYANGFYTDPIQIIANDGFVDSETYSLENPIVIRVDDASYYNNQLENHSTDLEQWTASQHEAFYVAYESIFTYELDRSVAALTDAQDKIDSVKTQTGVTESVTLTDWSDRMNLVTATVAIESAEASLQKADYENAHALVEGLSPSEDKDILMERKDELNRFHAAQDALITMEEEPSIVTWDKINEAQSFISVVENKTNKSSLQKRLNNVIKKYMSNITTVTPEDLENFETENVNPELGGMYDEYLDAFQPLGEGTNAQDLVDFVNALKEALQDLTPSQVNSLHSKVPSYAETALKPVITALDSLLEYRQYFSRDTDKDTNIASLIQKVTFGSTNDYMNTMLTAMQEVIEYNVTHDEEEKAEGVTAILPLWDGQLKKDMQAYLDNGIPEIIILEDPYEYINNGSFEVIGSIQDFDDTTHTVTVTFNGIEKSTISTNGSFNVTFDNVSDGIYIDEISVDVKDQLTTKTIIITNKPVITVSDVELFKKFVKALTNDLSQPFVSFDPVTLNSLKSIFDDVTSISIDSSDRKIRDIENAAQSLSGQEEGELETLVKNIFTNIRLEWLIANYQTANVEDFAWAGVVGVTTNNIADLKVIITDYVSQFTGNDVILPQLQDYQDWLEFQSLIVEARNTMEVALQIIDLEDLDASIKAIEDMLGPIPDWITVKQELQNQLDVVNIYYNALEGVIGAETTFDQADKDNAQILVDLLSEDESKNRLQLRLDTLQIVIDAVLAVEYAETTLDPADQLVAQNKVDLIADDHPKKDELQNRLDSITELNLAIAAVGQAEESYSQTDKDTAQNLVDSLSESEKKTELEERLTEVQIVIDAIVAVMEAENSLNEDDIQFAQTKVTAIADENSKKEELQNRLQAAEKLRKTIQAVAHAESTNTQVDKDLAQEQVDLLPSGEYKSNLQERLDALQLVIDAIQAVEVAETTLDAADHSIAQEKVSLIADENPKKSELQNRLDTVSSIHTAMHAVAQAESTYSQDEKNSAQELVEALVDSVTKTELENRLIEVQKVIDAIAAVEIAEESLNEEDILSAQTKITAIADVNPKKAELQSLLDAIETLRMTIQAVSHAESTNIQADKDVAQQQVDLLPNGESKETLQARLDALQLVIDAIAAVEKAETTLDETDHSVAQEKVDLIAADNPKKEELQNRLDVISSIHTAMHAVSQAESTYSQADKNSAQDLVNTLVDSTTKTELENRLIEVQKVIDAIDAVAKAEESLSEDDILSAQTKVTAVADGNPKKAELQSRIDAIETLTKTIQAVAHAESTNIQVDKDLAQAQVNSLPEGEYKSNLQERLDALQLVIDAIQAVEIAENSLDESDYSLAQSKVDLIADENPKKEELQNRLDTVSGIHKAMNAVAQAERTYLQIDKDSAQELVDALGSSATKVALQDKLTEVQIVIDAVKAVENAEMSLEEEDILSARTKVSEIAGDNPIKEELQNRLVAIESLNKTIQAVALAESTNSQADKDTAQQLVDLLPDGDNKKTLQNRLDALQLVIDAIFAVEVAETTLDKADHSAAQGKVDLIADDNPKKSELQSRLEDVTAIHNAAFAVSQAEETYLQADKDIAQDMVAALPDSETKIDLENRLNEVQKVLDAIDAVVEAEKTVDETDILFAQSKINEVLDNNPKKEELQSRLDAIESLRNTLIAVAKAESTYKQEDKDEAQNLVDGLSSSDSKVALHERLVEVQKVINALTAVKVAETSLTDSNLNLAQDLVEAIADANPIRSELQEQLNWLKQLKKATDAVEYAETTLVLLDKEKAQNLVDALADCAEKDALIERLNILQLLLEKLNAEQIATNAVEKAESTFSQSDKDAALEIVEALEEGPVKDELLDRLDQLQNVLDNIVEIESAVAVAEDSKMQEDVDLAQGMLDELVDSDVKTALQNRLDAVNQYIEAEKAVSNAEENLYQRVKDAAQELVDALPDSPDKQALQDRLDVLQDILDGKATDLLDDLINNPETVTPEDLADYTDETVYEELMPDYIDEIGNIGESITKDQVIEVVRLINKLELAKRSMLAADILAYQQELEQTSLPTKSNYPEPALMSSIATYVQNDSELENIITLIAAELNRSADEIREEITALLEGTQKQFVGFYVVKYQTETGEEIESYTFDDVEFGQIDVVANVPAGYELVGESDYSFELTEDNTGHEVIFTVKESAAVKGDFSVRYELEDGTLIFESNLTAIFGEVTVSAEVPEGYTLVGNPSYSFELTEDNSGYEVVFVVKEDVSSLGDYTVRYQLEDGTIINEHHETAEFGEVTVTADAPKGYTVIGDASSSFVLTEENSGYEIVFVIKEEATQAGEYTVNYLLEDGSVISESTLTAPYGELTVTAEVPVGFVLADGAANQQTVHFEEETPLEITFTIKVPETSVGNYVVQYVLDDLSVIEEKTFTAEYGDVNVVAVLPDGYELSETEDSHKTFELSEITEGTVLKFVIQPIGNEEVIEGEKEETFVPEIEEEVTEPETVEFENISEDVPMIEGANDGNETVIASTIGEETVFVRSLMQVASLDNLYLTTTPYVAELPEVVADGEAHGEYLFKSVQALAIVKAHINNPTEESKSEAIAYIASNIYDGAYKKQLLDLLEYDIKDIGDDGEPDLTPVFPTPPPPPTVDPNPTPPSVDPEPDVEEPPIVNPEPWIPPVPKPEKPSIEIPDIPGGETIAKDGNVDQTDIDGGYEWTITKPTESVYTLKADGIEITVPIEIEADVWEIKWVHTGEEHYNLTVIADGKAITTFKKSIKVSKTHDHAYLLRSIKRTYSAMPYTYQSNKFKFETKTTGEFYFSQTKVTFDDIENVYSKAAIEELASRHIVFGTTSETYSPNSKLTRAQFAAMLTRALALEATGENPFADTKGKWFEKDVQALYEAGIIKGTSATTFDPNAYITRQQAASMLEKILEHTESKVYIAKIGEVASIGNTVAYPNAIASTFEDSHQISDYAKNAVGLLQSLGVISGKEGNVFDPKGHLTRAQMAKILTGTLNYTDKF